MKKAEVFHAVIQYGEFCMRKNCTPTKRNSRISVAVKYVWPAMFVCNGLCCKQFAFNSMRSSK